MRQSASDRVWRVGVRIRGFRNEPDQPVPMLLPPVYLLVCLAVPIIICLAVPIIGIGLRGRTAGYGRMC